MQVKIRSAPCNDSSPIIHKEQELNRQFLLAVDLEQGKIKVRSKAMCTQLKNGFSAMCSILIG